VGNGRVLLDAPYHTYTAEGFAPCASSLLVSNLYNTPNCFCSRYCNINPFIYFVCFTIYLISRFEMPLPSDSRAPTFWPRAATAQVQRRKWTLERFRFEADYSGDLRRIFTFVPSNAVTHHRCSAQALLTLTSPYTYVAQSRSSSPFYFARLLRLS
jgi:hypothetical protein